MTRSDAHHYARLPPGEYRAGGRVHAPSRVAPPVGRHQLPQGSSTYYFRC